MAYSAWSVIAGEQPTASKWNQLGTNDASFNDGTGIGTSAILQRHIGQTGMIVNEQIFLDASQTNGSSTIPYDDTIPQISEGSQFLSASYTPIGTGNKLIVSALVNLYQSSTTAQNMAAALFNGNANAIAAHSVPGAAGSNALGNGMMLEASMTTVSTSPITFTVRAGMQISGTISMNGIGSGRFFGGVWQSFIKVIELKP